MKKIKSLEYVLVPLCLLSPSFSCSSNPMGLEEFSALTFKGLTIFLGLAAPTIGYQADQILKYGPKKENPALGHRCATETELAAAQFVPPLSFSFLTVWSAMGLTYALLKFGFGD